MELDKEFRPGPVEAHWTRRWEEEGLFVARPDSGRAAFSMVLPPPNVTGNVHIGHLFEHTLHDVIARWRRMQGYDVLWLPGTDHAGIATQMVVERELAKQGVDRRSLGRERFLERVWEWKRTTGAKITGSLRRLGASCDWTRERFTLDPGLSRAVRAVFVRLYREGLVYRGRYIVNWCPRCRTALSDLETVHETVTGKLWRVRYPSADGSFPGIVVATTRPETMLADTAVAVHPDDERYGPLVGRTVLLPLTGRTIPILADGYVDPSFGTGAVKVTPAHDPKDFEAARRLGLPEVVVLDAEGRMTAEAGEFAGLDRFEARRQIVRRLEELGLLEGVEDHVHAVGHCQRCKTPIEPLVSTQWFVRVGPLAREAIRAVEEGRTVFVPSHWTKTYFEWMRNIHDWCISRQLWWGHRIPAWTCERCGALEVHEEDPSACSRCGGPLRQDEDVLDTWFSSALWPFSTLGWPERTRDLERYYPTSLLITGFDIIFFWVARMLMMGLKFMGEVPFRKVYIHGLVRDAHGQKMSKTKGNVIEPEEVQDRYGTDAVRFTLAILAAPGNDIPLAPERMEGYRAFANKLWNAARFVLLRAGEEGAREGEFGPEDLTLPSRWIRSRATRLVTEVTEALEEFRFDRAAEALYQFAWHEFCDWYVEAVKPDLAPNAPAGRAAASRHVLVESLDTLLRLLHPFMPFVTEELWQKIPHEGDYLARAPWPAADTSRLDPEAERDMALLQEVVVSIRNLRAQAGLRPSQPVEVLLHADEPRDRRLLEAESPLVGSLCRARSVRIVDRIEREVVAVRGVARSVEVAIPLDRLLDRQAERSRLGREIEKLSAEIAHRARRLSDRAFLERAPRQVIEKEEAAHREALERLKKLEADLAHLEPGAAS
jgi:valyl-tRNA synthetase